MRITDSNGLREQIDRNNVRCEYYGRVFDNGIAVRSKFLFTIKSFGCRSSKIAEAFQQTGGGYLMLFGLLDKKLMQRTGIKLTSFTIDTVEYDGDSLLVFCKGCIMSKKECDDEVVSEKISIAQWNCNVMYEGNDIKIIALYYIQ